MGGPPKIWSEEANRKRVEQMAKGQQVKEEKVTKKVEEKVKPEKEKPVKKDAKLEKKGKASVYIVTGKTKEKKERKSRGPVIVDGKITIIAKENPKRKGTKISINNKRIVRATQKHWSEIT